MKKLESRILVAIFATISVVGLGLGAYALLSISKTTGYVSLPNKPIHWHPHLEITIKGEKIAIPANVGMGTSYSSSPFYDPMMDMTNMHTHDSSGTVHWEVMMHAPTREDLYLGNFFQVWKKNFNKNCIFEFCNGAEGSIKMLVNGKQNYDFEKYIVRDGDEIVVEFR
ncbi:MAG: hypothetical protein HYT72_03915 [Candidatus Aenigmarchaeota archaeon]|nr:hypothetical protein [Candidatus Aenigmarchaeota archaeon]